jgi:hypothetical protein
MNKEEKAIKTTRKQEKDNNALLFSRSPVTPE